MTKTEDTEQLKKINNVLKRNAQESIVLRDILENGSTTVRDLVPKMNCPYGAIRDLQKTYGILLYDSLEKRTKTVIRNGKECKITTPYKRYFLAKMKG